MRLFNKHMNKKEIAIKMGGFHKMITPEQEKKMAKENKMKEPSIIDDIYYYPETIRFKSSQLPEIKKWEVGKEYEIVLKVKMSSYEETKVAGRKEKEEAKFEIIAVKANK